MKDNSFDRMFMVVLSLIVVSTVGLIGALGFSLYCLNEYIQKM